MIGFDFPVLRGRTEARGRAFTAQVAMSFPWAEAPVMARKFAVRRVKTLLFEQGVMCAVCAEAFDPDPPACVLCRPARLLLWDGREEYPVTNDMLRAYTPSTRFNLVAVEGDRPASYASLELVGEQWTQMVVERRQQVMRGVVEKYLGLYPGADLGAVRTFVSDGKRQIPYPVNWPDVLGDQGR